MTLTKSGNNIPNSQGQRSAVLRVIGRGLQAEIVLDDKLPFPELERGIRSYMARNPRWFEGANVTLNVGRRVLSIKEVTQIKEIMEREFKLTISGLWCGPEILETLISNNVQLPVEVITERERPAAYGDMDWQETMLFKGTCRSGTTIHNNGNLVILGDVNPGAEVTAAGDILVFGRLSGLAHAGVEGNIKATILATSIDAHQVRIGPYIRFEGAENGAPVGTRPSGIPSLVRVESGQIVLEPYVTSSNWRQNN